MEEVIQKRADYCSAQAGAESGNITSLTLSTLQMYKISLTKVCYSAFFLTT
nr:MAG TPA: hypothetical protein [Caudoviricetes sp.]